MREVDLQRAVARYLDHLGVLWCHVANERKTKTRRLGGFLVGLGVKSGVPDVLIFEPQRFTNEDDFYAALGSPAVGLAIELKVGKNRPTVKQSFWLNSLRAKGWQADVCYDFDQAKKVIDNYLNIK